MTKLTSRIVIGMTILGLAAPALAATNSTPVAEKPAKVQVRHQHKRLAAADEKKETKGTKAAPKVEKKADGSATAKSAPSTETASKPETKAAATPAQK
jgi:hypothetical protein